MSIISSKAEVNAYLDKCLQAYHTQGAEACASQFEQEVLSRKVKFPLLEYCALRCYQTIDEDEHMAFCDRIEALKTEGENVILGIMLQKRLNDHFKASLQKATAYIADANAWYVCDIIGERVYGYALLQYPFKTIPELGNLIDHPRHWVQRALGAGVHYAIKKGLDKEQVKTVFQLLLSLVNSKDKEIRQGVGWAAKTTARFHPDVIEAFEKDIQNEAEVANWFRKKVDMGLNRNKHAKGN